MPIEAVAEDLDCELRLHGYLVRFRHDVTGKVKATCRTFPHMLERHDGLDAAIRGARKKVQLLGAIRMAARTAANSAGAP